MPHGSAYLVGFNRRTKARLGYIGKTGFRADEPPTQERFLFDNGGAFEDYHSGIARRILTPQGYFQSDSGGTYVEPRYVIKGPFAFSLVFVQTDDDKIYQIDLSQPCAPSR